MPETKDNHRGQASSAHSPVTFETVLKQEIDQITKARASRGVPTERTSNSLIGLAFSGGGIRSATFNLGFVQAMASERLLGMFDYLSTVSGGGYIGSWLAAVTQRFLAAQAGKTFRDVETALKPEEYKPTLRRERSFLHWLRMYSNYLTPHTGLASGDTWAMIGTWTRNAFLNQTILGLFFLGVFAFFQSLLLLLAKSRSYALTLLISGAVLLFAAGVSMAHNVADHVAFREIQKPTFFRRTKVTFTVMLPYLMACIVLNTGLWRWKELEGSPLWMWLAAGALFYSLVWGTVAVVAWRRQHNRREGSKDREVSVSALLIFSPIAGLVGSGLLWVYEGLLSKPRLCTAVPGCGAVNWMVVAFGPGAVMLCLLAVGAVHLGLTGRGCRDLAREWWARLGGYMILLILAWLVVAGISAFGPLLVRWALFKMGGWSIGAALLWVAHNYLGVRVAKSALTTGQTSKDKSSKEAVTKANPGEVQNLVSRVLQSPQLLNAIAKAAPYVFGLGLLLLLSTAVHIGAGAYSDRADTSQLWQSSQRWSPCCGVAATSPASSVDWATLCHRYWAVQYHGRWWCLLLAMLILVGSAVALSWRVDVNDFSLHHFYRNRLVRCYLGASNPARKPQPFTGFDPHDDLDLQDLGQGYPGPYPILNAALNVTTGEELGYATRRAKSFIFSPLYCGYEVSLPEDGPSWFLRSNRDGKTFVPTYSPTAAARTEKALTKVESGGGISLGTAMAISGAAASPNMGYYTSAATGLFMTLFDVRLGWWMGNPRYKEKWKSPGPVLGLGYLFSELAAQSDQKKSFVYLSDGGHFENLAVYELLKRHCKVIVACDVDADPKYEFENLLALIEKARIDLGADIVLKVGNIGDHGVNYVVGDIFYNPQDHDGDKGKFIYVKASMPMRPQEVKAEPKAEKENLLPDDVWSYKEKHKTFPHQSTADQWFDERQFESYRALGEFIGREAAVEIRTIIADALK